MCVRLGLHSLQTDVPERMLANRKMRERSRQLAATQMEGVASTEGGSGGGGGSADAAPRKSQTLMVGGGALIPMPDPDALRAVEP